MTALRHELLDLARQVGLTAADFVRQSRPAGRVDVAATKSSVTDVVTELDRRTEELIRREILGRRPDDGFLGEEGQSITGSSGVTWIVDPIDGTVNFVYGVPAYAVSIAAQVGDEIVAGFVVDVPREQAWGASIGDGAWTEQGGERRAITAPVPGPLAQALVATGFSYDVDTRAAQAAAVARLLPQVRDIRRIGAAALDLCAVADGRFDAYVEQGLQPWDLAAGGLIATESGLIFRGFDGPADNRLAMAAHPLIAEEYFSLVLACGF